MEGSDTKEVDLIMLAIEGIRGDINTHRGETGDGFKRIDGRINALAKEVHELREKQYALEKSKTNTDRIARVVRNVTDETRAQQAVTDDIKSGLDQTVGQLLGTIAIKAFTFIGSAIIVMWIYFAMQQSVKTGAASVQSTIEGKK